MKEENPKEKSEIMENTKKQILKTSIVAAIIFTDSLNHFWHSFSAASISATAFAYLSGIDFLLDIEALDITFIRPTIPLAGHTRPPFRDCHRGV